jgi:hypothetical protein
MKEKSDSENTQKLRVRSKRHIILIWYGFLVAGLLTFSIAIWRGGRGAFITALISVAVNIIVAHYFSRFLHARFPPKQKAHQQEPETTQVSKEAHLVEGRRPPALGSLFLCLLPPNDREVYWGDLEEKFLRWVEDRGLFMARLLYLNDCIRLAGPILKKWAQKVGAFAFIEEFIRRMIG